MHYYTMYCPPQSKSPLWAHLTAYAESTEADEATVASPPSHPPSPPLLSSSMSSLTVLSSSTGSSPSSSSAGEGCVCVCVSGCVGVGVCVLYGWVGEEDTVTVCVAATGEASSRSGRGITTQFRRRKFGSPHLRSQIEGILQPAPSSLLTDFL